MDTYPFFRNQISWNLLQVHLLPDCVELMNDSVQTFSIQHTQTSWDTIKTRVSKQFPSAGHVSTTDYYMQDLCNSYDTKTDLFKVSQKEWIMDYAEGPFYGIGYHYEVLPSYRFPMTNKIEAIVQKDITSYRISHRIHIHFEKSTWQEAGAVYTIYMDAHLKEQMDQERFQEDLQRGLRVLQEAIGNTNKAG